MMYYFLLGAFVLLIIVLLFLLSMKQECQHGIALDERCYECDARRRMGDSYE